MSFKQEVYIVVNFENSSDKALVTKAVRESLEPEFEKLIKKIKVSSEDRLTFKKLTGFNADIRVVPKRTYIENISR